MEKKKIKLGFNQTDQLRPVHFFVSLASIFFIFLLLLAVLFSRVFTEVGTKIISQNYSSYLSMISKYYQQLRFNTVPIASQLLDDDNIQNYLFARKGKDEAMLDAYLVLDDLVARNSYLNSVYLFNDEYGFFSSLKGGEGFDNLSDTTLIDFLREQPKNETLYQRSIPSRNSEQNYISAGEKSKLLNIFSICNNYYDKDGNLVYGIIVNMDETKARELLSLDMEGHYADFYLFSENGKRISSPDPQDEIASISDSLLFSKIHNEQALSGYKTITNAEGKQFLASWLNQPSMNWKLVYLIPMDDIQTPMNTLRNKLIGIFICIMLLALLVIYSTSKRVEKNLSRRARLISYIRGNIDNSSFLLYKPETLFSTAVIKVNYKKNEQIQSEALYTGKRDYEYIVRYFRANKMKGYLLSMEPGIYLFLSLGEIQHFIPFLQKLQIDAGVALNVALNALYEEGLTSFEDLPDTTASLISSIKTINLEQSRFILPNKEIGNEKREGLVLFDTSSLENALVLKDSQSYKKEVIIMIEALKAQQDWELFRSLKVYIYYAFQAACKKHLKIKSTVLLDDWKKHIVAVQTYQELESALLEINQLIEKSLNEQFVVRQSELIDTIKHYINTNLTNMNLSSALIADELKFSLGYVRSQYKEVEGESINDYIGRNRLQLASKLLSETDKSVNSIREEVGFSNYSYFCTYFKKIKGVSPSTYRKELVEAKLNSATK